MATIEKKYIDLIGLKYYHDQLNSELDKKFEEGSIAANLIATNLSDHIVTSNEKFTSITSDISNIKKDYLKLTGGTLTGTLKVDNTNGLEIEASNQDIRIWDIHGSKKNEYGFCETYNGIGSGNDNLLILTAFNQNIKDSEGNPKHVNVRSIKQDGTITVHTKTTFEDVVAFNKIIDGNISGTSNNVTGVVLPKHGGTGQDNLDDFVRTFGNQSIEGNKTFTGQLDIRGLAADHNLRTRGIVGSTGEGVISDLYLQYDANSLIYLGNKGGYTISADGGTYSGKAADSDKLDGKDSTDFVRSTGDIIQDITGNKTFKNNVTISGNLTVSGKTTTLNVENLDVKDKLISLGISDTPNLTTADGSGIQATINKDLEGRPLGPSFTWNKDIGWKATSAAVDDKGDEITASTFHGNLTGTANTASFLSTSDLSSNSTSSVTNSYRIVPFAVDGSTTKFGYDSSLKYNPHQNILKVDKLGTSTLSETSINALNSINNTFSVHPCSNVGGVGIDIVSNMGWSGNKYAFQYGMDVDGTDGNLYIRKSDATGTWSTWRKVWHTGSLPPPGTDNEGKVLKANKNGTISWQTDNNSWRPINDSYSGTSTTTSLSQKGANDLYKETVQSLATSTKRDFSNGTLIETNIDYTVTNGDPFYLTIAGNSYGRNHGVCTQVQGHIYSDTIINYGVYHAGANPITGIKAMLYNKHLCFWFPRQSYWEGYSIFCSTAYNYNINRIISVTDVANPRGTKVVNLGAKAYTAVKYDASGNSTIPGSITATSFNVSSARKFKENIHPTNHPGLDTINAAEVVDYNYIADKNKDPKVGLIADDCPAILAAPDRMSLDMNNCIGVLMKAVQELSEQNKELTRRIEVLERSK